MSLSQVIDRLFGDEYVSLEEWERRKRPPELRVTVEVKPTADKPKEQKPHD